MPKDYNELSHPYTVLPTNVNQKSKFHPYLKAVLYINNKFCHLESLQKSNIINLDHISNCAQSTMRTHQDINGERCFVSPMR